MYNKFIIMTANKSVTIKIGWCILIYTLIIHFRTGSALHLMSLLLIQTHSLIFFLSNA